MTISAKIITDSIGPNKIRITTFLLTYPRFIHSEFMTHRMFSRNASSSRAIPFEKQVKMIEENPAMPIEFRKNQKGMQAGLPLEHTDQFKAKEIWLQTCDETVGYARKLNELEVHKQYVNRLLEPFNHITVVCTATEYANFFALRCHPDAQPEIQELAKQMHLEIKNNKPKELKANEWHLPFVSEEELKINKIEDCIKMSVARCARTSYLNHDNSTPDLEKDLALYEKLVGNAPLHASPAEHQAQVMPVIQPQVIKWSGNFKGWLQYRQTLKNQNITKFEES